jgi:hypothetical protein
MSVELIEVLYAAVHSELGVCVETNDAERLRQKLYPMRKENPDFEPLSFIISPLNGIDLWIIRQPKEKLSAEE